MDVVVFDLSEMKKLSPNVSSFKFTTIKDSNMTYSYVVAIIFLLVILSLTYVFPTISQKIVNYYNQSIYVRIALSIIVLGILLIPGLDLSLSLTIVFGLLLIITSSNAINYNCPQPEK